MLYPYLPVSSFIATILALIPLPRQIRVRNVATISASFWLFGGCLIHGVNPIIWAGNVRNSAPVWCDISNHFRLAAIVGLPAATFCACKHLELISSKRPISSNANPLRRKLFESAMCFGLPGLWLFVFYSFQNARYVIVENFGCDSLFLRSNVAIGIMASLPMLLSSGTLLYGSIALYHLVKHHKATSKLLAPHLKSRDAVISWAQYHRVMAMSITLGIWGIVVLSVNIKLHLELHPVPLESWKAIHSTDSAVLELPTIVLANVLPRFQVLWWSFPGSAYAFFLLFGTSPDVWLEYKKFWVWFRTKIVPWPLPRKSAVLSPLNAGSIRSDTLPIYIEKNVTDGWNSSGQSSRFETQSFKK